MLLVLLVILFLKIVHKSPKKRFLMKASWHETFLKKPLSFLDILDILIILRTFSCIAAILKSGQRWVKHSKLSGEKVSNVCIVYQFALGKVLIKLHTWWCSRPKVPTHRIFFNLLRRKVKIYFYKKAKRTGSIRSFNWNIVEVDLLSEFSQLVRFLEIKFELATIVSRTLQSPDGRNRCPWTEIFLFIFRQCVDHL